MARRCCVPVGEGLDEDFFVVGSHHSCQAQPFWRNRSRVIGSNLLAQPCSSPLPVEGDKDKDERRDIVAQGLKRFEGIGKVAPPQPAIERLSGLVVNVLACNPNAYTLNGTNCYLVGNGEKRILIDCGEIDFGQEEFQLNLDKAMENNGVKGLEMILVTHLHTDHVSLRLLAGCVVYDFVVCGTGTVSGVEWQRYRSDGVRCL